MKILLLTERFGDTIPTGVLSWRMADELRKLGNKIAVVSSPLIGEKWPYGPHIICKVKKVVPGRILLFISNLLGLNIDSYRWRKKMYKLSINLIETFKPDVIYARSTPVSVCDVAAKLKRTTGIKVLMHFTDPVPAPIEWDSNKGYRKRMISLMNKLLEDADFISFGNQAMMNYQQSIQDTDFIRKSFISPDSCGEGKLYYTEPVRKTSILLVYLGSLYGSRNPNPLFEALECLNHGGTRYTMKIFDINRVGTEYPDCVEFVGRTDDVRTALLSADILVNIDGDDSIPVFISSKIKEYLCCCRPILSITPKASPSEQMVKNLNTVLSVENKTELIKNAILKIENSPFLFEDYLERESVVMSFSAERVAAEVNTMLREQL